jgi:hypothetical protein
MEALDRNQQVDQNQLNHRRTCAEALFPSMAWENETTGFVECPGIGCHSSQNGRKDCRVTIDGVPTVYCVHASCQEAVAESNQQFRAKCRESCPALSPQERKKAAAQAKATAVRLENLRLKATNLLPVILRQHHWSYAEIIDASPLKFTQHDRAGMFGAFLDLFSDDDIVWIGDVMDTGKPDLPDRRTHNERHLLQPVWRNGRRDRLKTQIRVFAQFFKFFYCFAIS